MYFCPRAGRVCVPQQPEMGGTEREMDMRPNRFVLRVTVLLLVLFVLSASVCPAFAAEDEYQDENGAAFLKSDPLSAVSVRIINFKARLYELGFYASGADDSVLQSKELDDLTMAAVMLVCRYNPEFTYHEDGVSNDLYWRVMGDTEGPLITPEGGEYETISKGEKSEAVTQLQNRLNQLGYDAAAGAFTPGVYDDTLQGAIDAFVRSNKMVYDEKDTITEELQKAIFDEEAQPYSMTLVERVLAYVRGTGNVFGLKVPNAVVLLVGFLCLCVIVALVVKLVVPSPSGKEASSASSAGKLKFEVEYEGKSFVHTADKNAVVCIGRGVGNFPLNIEDKSISREHCEIAMEGGELVLKDKSSYGTKINGTLCHNNSQALHSGDVLEIGKHKITVRF